MSPISDLQQDDKVIHRYTRLSLLQCNQIVYLLKCNIPWFLICNWELFIIYIGNAEKRQCWEMPRSGNIWILNASLHSRNFFSRIGKVTLEEGWFLRIKYLRKCSQDQCLSMFADLHFGNVFLYQIVYICLIQKKKNWSTRIQCSRVHYVTE